MNAFAAWLVRRRVPVLAVVGVLTAILAWRGWPSGFTSDLTELLPAEDPFVKTQFRYEHLYGGPLMVRLLVVAEEQSIFTRRGVETIAILHDYVDALPGINHDQVLSLASPKVRYTRADEYGVATNPVIDRNRPLPATVEELQDLRNRVERTPGVRGAFVSFDGSAALVSGVLIPGAFAVNDIFERLSEAAQAHSRDGIRVHMLGEPVRYGWVLTHKGQILLLIAASILVIFISLWRFARSAVAMLLATAAGLVSAIWGAGVAGLFGMSADLLIVVVPLLVAARTLSHSVQMALRYLELIGAGWATTDAVERLIVYQFKPGLIGIVTDAAAILVLLVSSIPMIDKLAVFAGVWALSGVVSVLVMGPLLASLIPITDQMRAKAVDHSASLGILGRILNRVIDLVMDRRARIVLVMMFVVFVVVGIAGIARMSLGDTRPGSSLFWPDAPYNVASAELSRRFLATEDLALIARPDDATDIRSPQMLRAIWNYQKHTEIGGALAVSSSFVDLLPEVRRVLSGGNPKFATLPRTEADAGMLVELLQSGSAPGDFDRYFAPDYSSASIRYYVRDRLEETVERVIGQLQDIAHQPDNTVQFPGSLQFAMGSIALQAAANSDISWTSKTSNFLVLIIIAVCCYVGFRRGSLVLILMFPLIMVNLFSAAIMDVLGIGLDVNTLPISVVGAGVGIDYAIYIMSRAIEERHNRPGASVEDVLRRALETSGRAVSFTALTMVAAMAIWFVFADLRFHADIGLMLAIIMGVNFIAAIFYVPLGIVLLGPRSLQPVLDINPHREANAREHPQSDVSQEAYVARLNYLSKRR